MADAKHSKSTRDSMAWLHKMSEEAQSQAEEQAAQAPKQMFLPGMDEVMRAMPNHIARSSLFAPVARGRKRMHDGTILQSREDAEIRFSGKQLDEAQADVWMQCMKEAQCKPLGEPVTINRAEFLRSIGRAESGQNYKWLHRTMQELAFAMLVIEVTRKDGKPKLAIGRTRALHLIAGFDYDDKTETYTLTIDPRWHAMYGNREFALIDWEKRLEFGRGQDMAKALQRLLATSSNPVQRYGLDWLKAKMEYASPMRKFRESLTSACKELERLTIITSHRIEDSTKGQPQLTLFLPSSM